MSDLGFTFAVAAICVFFGGLLGNTAANDAWREDCKAMQHHRSGDAVYECKVKENK